MGKEKCENSITPAMSFPAGEWSIYIRTDSVYIGRLNLVESSRSTVQYGGSIDFGTNPNFGPIAGGGFSVDIVAYDSDTGVICFKIPTAAEEYNSNTSPPYQFVFIGYCGPGKMYGIARVPKGFGIVPGGLGEDGDDVTWTSVGHGDPEQEPSK